MSPLMLPRSANRRTPRPERFSEPPLLHRPPDLRLGPLHRDRGGGSGVHAGPARCPVPRDHAPGGADRGRLSGRERRGGGRRRGTPDRSAASGHRQPSLLRLDQHQRWAHDPPAHLRDRDRCRYRRRPDAEPREASRAAVAPRGRPPRHHGEKSVPGSPGSADSGIDRSAARRLVSRQLRDPAGAR